MPPLVTRQSPKSPTQMVAPISKTGTILDRIIPVSKQGGVWKVCVYGRTGTGKTRFACTFPKPLIILGAEDGTKSVSNVKDVSFIRLKYSQDIYDVLQLLDKGLVDYKTIVLDTAGGYQDLILKEVLGLDQIPIQRSWGMAKRDDWGTVGVQLKERLSALFNQAEKERYIVIIAHERDYGEDSGNSDVIVPHIGAALTPNSGKWLHASCDYICHAFIREQMTITKQPAIGGTGEELEFKTPTGKKEYCLRLGAHSAYATRFRLPIGVTLPDTIVLDERLGPKMGYEQLRELVEPK